MESPATNFGALGEFRIPFVFSTNGRPFLRQLAEQSGVWFCDVRRPENLGHVLDGWYTPEGLNALLQRDDDVQRKELKLYVAYKRLKNFATLVPQRNRLLLYLHLDPAKVVPMPPNGQDVSEKGALGHGRSGVISLITGRPGRCEALDHDGLRGKGAGTCPRTLIETELKWTLVALLRVRNKVARGELPIWVSSCCLLARWRTGPRMGPRTKRRCGKPA